MSDIRERPIILTAQEVNAVLAGDKTQHRAPIEESGDTAILFDGRDWRYDGKEFIEDACCDPNPRGKHYFEQIKRIGNRTEFLEDYRSIGHCPLGKVGDRLWVQEPSLIHCDWDWFYADNTLVECKELFTSNDLQLPWDDEHQEYTGPIAAKFMPRWASRILLEITDIRIERVQDTSRDDAVAEGVHNFDIEARLRDQPLSVAQIAFSRHWDTKHQEHCVMWEDNPWVWVIEFKVIKESDCE